MVSGQQITAEPRCGEAQGKPLELGFSGVPSGGVWFEAPQCSSSWERLQEGEAGMSSGGIFTPLPTQSLLRDLTSSSFGQFQ